MCKNSGFFIIRKEIMSKLITKLEFNLLFVNKKSHPVDKYGMAFENNFYLF